MPVKNPFIYLIIMMLPLISQAAQPDATRERLLMDHGWRFAMGHAADVQRDFDPAPAASTFNYLTKAGFGEGASSLKFDDSTWRLLDLPHDWAVELPFDHRGSGSHGFKALGTNFPENSVGWYRRHFDIPTEDLGKHISITFDGVFRDSQVWVNGFYLGRHSSGYIGFSYDIGDYLNYGGENIIAVRVDASLEEGWFYEGAGIYRHVWLHKTSPLHLEQNGTFVRSEASGNDSLLHITTNVKNAANEPHDFFISYEVLTQEGELAHAVQSQSPLSLRQGETSLYDTTLTIPSPTLWDLDNPYLYTLRTSILEDGKLIDQTSTPFGIRYIEWTADKGFFLNGKRVEIKGTNNHQDFAGVGAAMPDSLQYERIRMLKAMGTNALRCSHNPPAPETLDACDRLGFLVMDENRETGINAQKLDSLRAMILRDRNHPSVVIWSLGNEEWSIEGNEMGPRVTTTMQNFARLLDDTRPYTVAISGGWGAGSSTVVDVMGFNYFTHGNIDDYHALFPDTPTIGTEDGASFSTRGIYFNDHGKAHITAYENSRADWSTFAFDSIPQYLTREWTAGQFRWTGFDYRGEPTPYGWPAIASQFGAMDLCGFPKDLYYYYKAWWGNEPVLHLFPHWNWKGREGETIAVWAYTNSAEVELILNGGSLGRKPVQQYGFVEWDVPFTPGKLTAIAYDASGTAILQDTVETTSDAHSITLSGHTTELFADGDSISLIRVECLDEQGRPIPTANQLVRFEISGPGRIIGVGNGDPSSHEPDRFINGETWQRHLFNGLAQVIVQSVRGEPGDIVLTASSTGLPPAQLHINSLEPQTLPPIVPLIEPAPRPSAMTSEVVDR